MALTNWKLVLFFLALFPGFASIAFGQGVGCSNAVVISSLSYTSPHFSTGNAFNSCAGNEFDETTPCASPFLKGGDFTFKHTAAADGLVMAKLLLESSAAVHGDKAAMFIYRGCPSSSSSACLDQTIKPQTEGYAEEIFYLEQGVTYYFVISSEFSCFDFQFDLRYYSNLGNIDTGKNPENALLISSLPFSKSVVEFPNWKEVSSCLNVGNHPEHTSHPDYFFKYQPADPTCLSIHVNRLEYYACFVYENDPTTIQGILITSFRGYSNSLKNIQLEGGKTYYIVLEKLREMAIGENDWTTAIPELTLKEISDLGDTCDNPIPLTEDIELENESTSCKEHDYGSDELGGSTASLGQDIVYQFELTEPACVTINLREITGKISAFLIENCPDLGKPVIASDSNATGGDAIYLQESLGPGTYSIVVSAAIANPDVFFDILLSFITGDNTPGINCASAIAIAPGDELTDQSTQCKFQDYFHPDFPGLVSPLGDDIVYEFTLTEPACVEFHFRGYTYMEELSFFLLDDCPNPNATVIAADSAKREFERFLIASLEAGTYYLVVSSFENFALNQFRFTFNTTPYAANTGCIAPVEVNQFPTNAFHVDTRCHPALLPGSKLNNIWNKPNEEEYFIRIASSGDECIEVVGRSFQNVGEILLIEGCLEGNYTVLAKTTCPSGACDSIRLETQLVQAGDYHIVVTAKDRTKSVLTDLDIIKNKDQNCLSCNNALCDDCFEVGFDNMSMDSWRLYRGDFFQPKMIQATSYYGANEVNKGSHTLMNKGVFDPYIPQLACTPPNGSDFSIRLGNKQTGAGGEAMEFSFTPTAENNGLLYWYAVVFQDPDHLPEEQPYFKISLFDEEQEEIECAHYEVRAGAGIEGFQYSPENEIRWKDWTPVYIPLGDYIGQTLTLEVINLDCKLGAHFGYSYFDLECKSMEVLQADSLLCTDLSWEDEVTLTGPLGFEKYYWSTGESGRTITTSELGTITLNMETVSGCKAELTTNVAIKGSIEFEAELIPSCFDTSITITSSANIVGDNISMTSQMVFLTDGTVVPYSNSLSFPITNNDPLSFLFSFETEMGCTLDTLLEYLPNHNPYSAILPDSITSCEGQDITLTIPSTTHPIRWRGIQSLDNQDFISFLPVSPLHNGYLHLEVGDNNPGSNNCLAFKDSVYFRIGAQPNPAIEGKDSLCISEGGYLVGIPNSPDEFTAEWNPPLSDNDTLYLTESGVYTYSVVTDLCNGTVQKSVVVGIPPEFEVEAPEVICEGDSAFIEVVLNTEASLHWEDNYPNSSRYWDSDEAIHFSVASESCSIDSVIQIAVSPMPQPVVKQEGTFCASEEFYLVGSPNCNAEVTTTWNGTFENVDTLVPGGSGTYRYEAFTDLCSAFVDISIHIDNPPEISLAYPKDMCEGDSGWIDLQLLLGDTIIWEDNYPNYQRYWSSGAPLAFSVTNNGCAFDSVVQIDFHPSPEPEILGNPVFCVTENAFLIGRDNCSDPTNSNWNSTIFNQDTLFPTATGQYTYTAYTDLCTNSVDIFVQIDTLPTLSLNYPEQICAGDSALIQATLGSGNSIQWHDGSTDHSRNWWTADSLLFSLHNGSCVIDSGLQIAVRPVPQPHVVGKDHFCITENEFLTGTPNCPEAFESDWNNTAFNSTTLYPTETGLYTYSVYTDLCSASVSLFVEVDTVPVFDAFVPSAICEDDSAYISFQFPTGYNFQWEDNHPAANRYLTDPNPLKYSISSGLCSVDSVVSFQIIANPTLLFSSDTTVCPGDSASIILLDSTNISKFYWSDGEQEWNRKLGTAGEYIAVGINQICWVHDTVRVNLFPAQTSAEHIPVCPDETSFFDPLDFVHDYFWLPDSTQHPKPIAEGMQLNYVAISQDGCHQQFQTYGKFNADCEQALYVPNSFSPNGDGTNDYFFPVHFKGSISLFQIYTRWGELIYESSVNNPWDGNFKDGSPCKPDTYVWRIVYLDRYKKNAEFKGNCTLIR